MDKQTARNIGAQLIGQASGLVVALILGTPSLQFVFLLGTLLGLFFIYSLFIRD